MNTKDLIKIYETQKKRYGAQAHRHISVILDEIKKSCEEDFKGTEYGQSWRVSKGRILEDLIVYIISEDIESLGLKIVNGSKLKAKEENLPEEMALVKRNLLVDYGEFGYYLPDTDIVIYKPVTGEVVAIISSKVTLRERVAQTGYWKIKLKSQKLTENIKVYFITLDEDGTLESKNPAKKGRAIVEVDTDGSYVLSERDIEESDKVKMFDKFIDDLKKIIKK